MWALLKVTFGLVISGAQFSGGKDYLYADLDLVLNKNKMKHATLFLTMVWVQMKDERVVNLSIINR